MARRAENPLEFFADRSLGKSIVEALCAQGLTVYSMAEVYGEEEAQRLADEVCLRDAGENDWVVLTQDDPIRRRPAERDALMEAAVRALCLTTARLRGSEQVERFVLNRHRILQQACKPGPYIYGVYESGLKRLWP
jgi:NAD(P)-dependent dehydrogenase (short-subunit alcohol dehydrogenase family)